jgi:hypothetical protein
MIVHDLDVPCRALTPFEANPPLIVNADAVLSAPITVQGFKAVARRNPQIVDLFGGVDGEQPRSRTGLNQIRQTLYKVTGKERGGALVGEAPDHNRETYRKTVRLSRPPRTASGPQAAFRLAPRVLLFSRVMTDPGAAERVAIQGLLV